MKYLEVSKKISLTRPVSPADLKEALAERIGKTITIMNMTDGEKEFSIVGTAGTPNSFFDRTIVNVAVTCEQDNGAARILISGYARPAMRAVLFYGLLFLVVLFVGLLPGSIETSIDSSGDDAIVFLIFGIYMLYDINRKLAEPSEFLKAALDSLNTRLG